MSRDWRTACRTPGAQYTTEIHNDEIVIRVKLKEPIEFSGRMAIALERDLHYEVSTCIARRAVYRRLEPYYTAWMGMTEKLMDQIR